MLYCSNTTNITPCLSCICTCAQLEPLNILNLSFKVYSEVESTFGNLLGAENLITQ